MKKLTRKDLYSLEEYAELRPEFRRQAMAHKKDRIVHLGPHASMHFEDFQTMHYQIQEILRSEKIFEADEIQDELDAYNQLIPDGDNWKATFMLEYPDPEVRPQQLARLINIEDQVWVQVDGHEKVWAIADEDMDRETEEKTSAVHFMRFQLDEVMRRDVKSGARIAVGVEHENYRHVVEAVPDNVARSLAGDLD